VQHAQAARVVELPVRRSRSALDAAIVSLRPRQWSKNVLLFAGVVFAAKFGDWTRWWEAAAAFGAYCAASSTAYLFNDLRDVRHDRAHPVKRDRPIARCELSMGGALGLAFALAAVALGASAALGLASLLFMLSFLGLQAAYSLVLKHLVLVDVLAIGGLFAIRAAAGAAAVDVRISPWLVICTGMLALFLGLAKRRGELVLVGAERTPGRPVLEGYSLDVVDQLVAVAAASTLISYSLYTFTVPHSKAMMVTIPFAVFGVFRYLLLVHRHDLGEEPETVLVSDLPILVTAALWAATAVAVLLVT
jgi:4-hydroxybenzoate polyprenyltransferase